MYGNAECALGVFIWTLSRNIRVANVRGIIAFLVWQIWRRKNAAIQNTPGLLNTQKAPEAEATRKNLIINLIIIEPDSGTWAIMMIMSHLGLCLSMN